MKRNLIFLFASFILAVFFLPSICAQEEYSLFVPFVSHLEARVQDKKIELNWVDSPSVRGPVYIYRSRAVFDANFDYKSLKPAQVRYRAQKYSEDLPPEGIWYYLVASSDTDGEKYNVVVPYNNMVEVNIDGRPAITRASSYMSPDTSTEKFAEKQKDEDVRRLREISQNDGAAAIIVERSSPPRLAPKPSPPAPGIAQSAPEATDPSAYYPNGGAVHKSYPFFEDDFPKESKKDYIDPNALYAPPAAYSAQPSTVYKLPNTGYEQIPRGGAAYAAPQNNAVPEAYTRRSAPPNTVYTSESGAPLGGLTVSNYGDDIIISFAPLHPRKKAVLYRSIRPIKDLSDLASSEIVLLPGALFPFVDKAAAGIPYYYAVVYDEDLRGGTAYISPGYNASIYPITARGGEAAAQPQTAHPLASVLPDSWTESIYPAANGSYPRDFETYSDSLSTVPLPSANDAPDNLSLAAKAALSNTSFTKPLPYQAETAQKINISQPKVFKEDLENFPEGSEEYRLSSIIKGAFLWRNWRQASSELQNFLSLSNNDALKSRARFYLGEVCYFLGDNSQALTIFLSIQSRFPSETSSWIQAALNRLAG